MNAGSSSSHRDPNMSSKKRAHFSSSTAQQIAPVDKKPALKRPGSSPLSPVQGGERQMDPDGSMTISNNRSSQRSLEMLEEENRALEEQELLNEVCIDHVGIFSFTCI